MAMLGSVLLFATGAQVQNPPTVASHFRWSERLAHELDYNHTIATAKELSPLERKNLLAFMFNSFRNRPGPHDEAMFENIPDSQLRKLAADTRIEFVDLSDDKRNEIIAQGNGLGPCGGTGNCIVMVLQNTPTGWKTLLDTHAQLSGGFEKIRVLDTSTNGYHDIVVAAHLSACERTASVLTYDKKQYRARECYNINQCAIGGARLPKPDIGVCAK